MQLDAHGGKSVQDYAGNTMPSTRAERLSGKGMGKGNSYPGILALSATSALPSMEWSALHSRCGAVQSA